MLKFLNKRIFIIFLAGLLSISAGLVFYFFNQKRVGIAPPGEKAETLAEKQLKELEELRNKAGIQSLTEEQILAQQKELEALRKKAGLKPLTQAQIQKPAQDGRGSLNEIERQLEELAALKDGEPPAVGEARSKERRPDESGRENLRQGR